MRVTAAQKASTRQKILEVARKSFRTKGYDATTTREIAVQAKIAAGTVFNYFPTKEAIAGALAEAAVAPVRTAPTRLVADSLEETLFAVVAAELRQLKPHRQYVLALVHSSFQGSPDSTTGDAVTSFRSQHLELIRSLVEQGEFGDLSPVALQLYWSLYTGVLAFWSGDASPKQEDTLALLDQSLEMFVGWLRSSSALQP